MRTSGSPKGKTLTCNMPGIQIPTAANSTLTERILFYTGMIPRSPIRESPPHAPDPDETQPYNPPLSVAGWLADASQPDERPNTLNTGSSHGSLFVPNKRE